VTSEPTGATATEFRLSVVCAPGVVTRKCRAAVDRSTVAQTDECLVLCL
jgi:hypothetical protein